MSLVSEKGFGIMKFRGKSDYNEFVVSAQMVLIVFSKMYVLISVCLLVAYKIGNSLMAQIYHSVYPTGSLLLLVTVSPTLNPHPPMEKSEFGDPIYMCVLLSL